MIVDDAISEIYYARLVEEESIRTVLAGLREVIENQGVFRALYSDRGGAIQIVDFYHADNIYGTLHPAEESKQKRRIERHQSWLPQGRDQNCQRNGGAETPERRRSVLTGAEACTSTLSFTWPTWRLKSKGAVCASCNVIPRTLRDEILGKFTQTQVHRRSVF
jgi:hypothetical protein